MPRGAGGPPGNPGRPSMPLSDMRPDMAPQTPQRSGQPGEPGPPLDTRLADWLSTRRWFAAKTRRIVATAVDDQVRVGGATLRVVRGGLDDGSDARYVVALGPGPDIVDALDDAEFCRALLSLVARGGALRGE